MVPQEAVHCEGSRYVGTSGIYYSVIPWNLSQSVNQRSFYRNSPGGLPTGGKTPAQRGREEVAGL